MKTLLYRRNRIPGVFTQIPFIRISTGTATDIPDELERNKQIQRVVSGAICISSVLDVADWFVIAASGLEGIAEFTGNSRKSISGFKSYFLKFNDLCNWLENKSLPRGAIPISESGLDPTELKKLAAKRSCIGLLGKGERLPNRGKGSYLSEERKALIRVKEAWLFAEMDIEKEKNSYGVSDARSGKSKYSLSRDVAQRIRILKMDGHECVFWKVDNTCSNGEPFEAGHIIPRAMIRKLHLNQQLMNADYNLTAMCFRCNRRISDNLSKTDVEFYLDRFAAPSHRNHKIVPYLKRIKDIQNMVE